MIRPLREAFSGSSRGTPLFSGSGRARNPSGRFRKLLPTLALALVGWGQETRKISNSEGGFGGTLLEREGFSTGAASLGDLNGDGVPDRTVSARGEGAQGVL